MIACSMLLALPSCNKKYSPPCEFLDNPKPQSGGVLHSAVRAVPSVYPSFSAGPISCSRKSLKGKKVLLERAATGKLPVCNCGTWQDPHLIFEKICLPACTSGSFCLL